MPSPRLLTYAGRTQSVAAWAADLGVSRITIATRLHKGWSVDRVLGQAVQSQRPIPVTPCRQCGKPGKWRLDPRNADPTARFCGRACTGAFRSKTFAEKREAWAAAHPCPVCDRPRKWRSKTCGQADCVATVTGSVKPFGEWGKAIGRGLSRIKQEAAPRDPWRVRCANSAVALRNRPRATGGGSWKPKQTTTWRETFRYAKSRFRARVKRRRDHAADPWLAACESRASNLRKRSRRRDEQQQQQQPHLPDPASRPAQTAGVPLCPVGPAA